jgi:hypothetical protein
VRETEKKRKSPSIHGDVTARVFFRHFTRAACPSFSDCRSFMSAAVLARVISCALNMEATRSSEASTYINSTRRLSQKTTLLVVTAVKTSNPTFRNSLSSKKGCSEIESTKGPLHQPRMMGDECGAVGGMRIGRGSRSTRRKPVPVALCPPQIPHYLTRARTRSPRWEASDFGQTWYTYIQPYV